MELLLSEEPSIFKVAISLDVEIESLYIDETEDGRIIGNIIVS